MPGIYIHIPFCQKKCRYCDFISFDNRDDVKDAYLSRLADEMQMYSGIEADTVFIGGGTPTSLSLSQLEHLFKSIQRNFLILPHAEFTIEANPKTLSAEKLLLMKKFGINRISVGVQSFSDDELLKIGRIHNSKAAIDTIELIKAHGFENFNIDLISALPSQNLDSFKKSLKTAVALNPAHISCYSLIIEDGTPLMREFENGALSLPDEDEERAMYEYLIKYLPEWGYNQYEISNFSLSGMESKHNIKYWQCDEYIGIGLSAHSYYNGARFFNTDNLSEYLSGSFCKDEPQILTLSDKIEEFAIMGLRMRHGISKKEFLSRFGFHIEDIYKEALSRFLPTSLLIDDGENIYLSEKGISVSNSIMCEFVTCNIKK